MDYHRFGGLGGSVPPPHLLAGAPTLGVTSLTDSGSGPMSIPGAHSPLLPPPTHHPSLLFHYGATGKPAVPQHLLAPVSAGNSNQCNSILNSKNGSSSRTMATVPPLTLSSSLTSLTTTAGADRSQSPTSSSFAAALRSLAKQATVPLAAEKDGSGDSQQISPKVNTLPTTSAPGVASSSVPPVVTIAPTHTHQVLADVRKPLEVIASEADRMSVVEDMARGFQPYRAPELPTVTAISQPSLRPTLGLELPPTYPYPPNLYPHHLAHQYRLEEQLYLERYSLLRPPLGPYAIGTMSGLYPAPPYFAGRYPPELIPSALSALHPSSALMHERLKLEEDIRQREYELELRRERELERGREKERERDKEKEREKESEREKERQKEKERQRQRDLQEQERLKEAERSKSQEKSSDKSPIHASAGALTNSSFSASSLSSSNNISSVTCVRKGQLIGIATQQAARPLEFKSSQTNKPLNDVSFIGHVTSQPLKSSQDGSSGLFNCNKSYSSSGSKRTPAIVRPFDTSPSESTAEPLLNCVKSEVVENQPLPNGVITHKPQIRQDKPDWPAVEVPVSSVPHRPVWQPVRLDSPPVSESQTSSLPASPVARLPSSPSPPPLRSRLDIEEQKLKKLQESGIENEQAEEMLFVDCVSAVSSAVLTGSTFPVEISDEKLSFLGTVGLTTHATADDLELNCWKRRAILTALTPTSPREQDIVYDTGQSTKALVLILASGCNLPQSSLTPNDLVASDYSQKARFLAQLSLQPQHSIARQKEIEAVWLSVIKERLKRYKESDSPMDEIFCTALEKLLQRSDMFCDNVQDATSALTDPLPPVTSSNNVSIINTETSDSVSLTTALSGQISKAAPATVFSKDNKSGSVNVKSFLNDVHASLLPPEQDPLLLGLQGIDSVIDHLIKNAQAQGGTNAVLLEHIEEVRRSQVAVCQTVQTVQEHVAKLIAARAQLEAHRATLHHHLASITNLLAANASLPVSNCLATTTAINASSGNEIATVVTTKPYSTCVSPASVTSACKSQITTSPTTVYSSLPTYANTSARCSAASVVMSTITNALATTAKSSPAYLPTPTIMSWATLPTTILANSNIDGKEGMFYPHISSKNSKDQKSSSQMFISSNSKISRVSSISSINKSMSGSRMSQKSSLSKVSSGVLSSSAKYNGTVNSLPQQLLKPLQLSCSPLSSSLPVTSGPSKSPVKMIMPSSQYGQGSSLVLNLSQSQCVPSSPVIPGQSKTLHNLPANGGPAKLVRTTKPAVAFAPYAKTTSSKAHTWISN